MTEQIHSVRMKLKNYLKFRVIIIPKKLADEILKNLLYMRPIYSLVIYEKN